MQSVSIGSTSILGMMLFAGGILPCGWDEREGRGYIGPVEDVWMEIV